ncbi:SusC/RagA family TonB-linked outer membrane protein [Pedobacter sp. GR22-10]|uniref:SusC/RagA family TonB-linked outer membrane protein n=1 Tax=Pedobacter sp. GR22-10 TaxID=2994472 RepID=UPI00224754AC|nr:SusC/RagA family TonB-linked outer membrane protein [Pedobacter sp. GR22-10]MCX2430173.1 SusC/RagA family TonB-linked outer membrane protein [Pedobacter sp. GR22-10]
MRLTTVILIAALMQVSAATFGQRITLHRENVTLQNVLKEIRKQSGYDFYYDSKTIQGDAQISVHVKNATISEVMQAAIKGLTLDFVIRDKTIIIKKKEEASIIKPIIRQLQIDVHGKVVGNDNNPISGVNIKVKGSGKSTVTDNKGEFYLSGLDENSILVISFIGYAVTEINAKNELGIIRLRQSSAKLDEVQVIGYGTTTSRLSTGSVATIKSEEIEKQPVSNPLLALQGRVPGLVISQSSGYAGSGVKVRIQGQNSISNGNDPFYVIDGIPYISQSLQTDEFLVGGSGGVRATDGSGNPLNFINPNDIESISVLKDADATSIYGSRAANGAILITTKRGKAGKTNIDFNLQNGFGELSKRLDVLNTDQYLNLRSEAFKNSAISPSLDRGDYDVLLWDPKRFTDWQKVLVGNTSIYTDLQGSVSGGNDQTQFRIGGNFHRETSVLQGDFADLKTSFHTSINHQSVDRRFKIAFSGSYLSDKNKMFIGSNDMIKTALELPPNAPGLYDVNGKLNWEPTASGVSTWQNPLSYLYSPYTIQTANLLANGTVSYRIIDDLELKSSFGFNKLESNEVRLRYLESERPENRTNIMRFNKSSSGSVNSWIIEPQLNYSKQINSIKISALLGTTFNKQISSRITNAGYGFATDQLMYNISAAPYTYIVNPYNAVQAYNAVFGSLNFNLKDRYIVNLSARRDGSSRFGPDNRWNNFAAIGAAWIFSDYEVVKENLPFLSFGKLRGSFGTTGNDQIGDYRYMSLYENQTPERPYQNSLGLQASNLPNTLLQWEESRKFSAELNLGFFKDRFLMSVNYYRNLSSNQLLDYQLPIVTGFESVLRNLPATVMNRGIDFSIDTKNIIKDGLTWSTGLNFSVARNKLLAYPGLATSSDYNLLVIGQPVGGSAVYRYMGINLQTGLYEFLKNNGERTSSPSAFDSQRIIMNPAPTFYGGINNSFDFKNFSISFFVQFTKQRGPEYLGTLSPGSGPVNSDINILNRWRQPGDVALRQRVGADFTNDLYQASDSFYSSDGIWQDASFIRLKNVSINYVIPKKIINKLNSARVYLQGQNLLTITKYHGLNPDQPSVDAILPPLRVITMGIQITL